MNETTERFLQEIATRVGYDRVAELYLFPVLRQGGVEGAVAVVAAYPDAPEAPEAAPEGADVASNAEPVEAAEASVDAEPAADTAASGEDADASTVPDEHDVRADVDAASDDETAPHAESAMETEETAGAEDSPEASAETDTERANASRVRARHVVYTARYRHTIKGTDRGRWAVEVVAEADAPLITVEEVVRGVVRRSGDEFQPERLSGDQFRALVRAPAAPGSAPA